MHEGRPPLRSQPLDSIRAFKGSVDKAAETAAAEQRQRAQEAGEARQTAGQELKHRFGDTVSWMSDLLNAANRDHLWSESSKAVQHGAEQDGEFLVLEQTGYPGDEGSEPDIARMVLPVDKAHADAARALLDLPETDRRLLLETGYYPEEDGEAMQSTGPEDDKNYSGLSRQLYDVLSRGSYKLNAMSKAERQPAKGQSDLERNLAQDAINEKAYGENIQVLSVKNREELLAQNS